MRQAGPHRVAVLAHGHPALSAGGAEIAAHTLHAAFRLVPEIRSLHVSCVPEGHPLAGSASGVKNDERFVETATVDPLHLRNRDPAALARLLGILRDFDPDTVHLHHVLGFGADVLFALRAALPNASIVLTLHEFISICHRQGQMVRAGGVALCERATPRDCNHCFPEIAPLRFLRREHALRALFSMVDRFIAPSAFLAGRYAAWGLPRAKITVIENAIVPLDVAPPPAEERSWRGRFAFFGQITPFKGVDLLLSAVTAIPDEEWRGCTLDIHGGGLERQPPAFQERMAALFEMARPGVTVHGPYANADLPKLMAEVDWVVVPSIWWENSPVVIQEAFRSRRPVIASAIGGMAEKVRDRVDGLTFRVGDAAALAACMTAASASGLWKKLSRNIVPAATAKAAAEAHLDIYRSLHSRQRSAPPRRLPTSTQLGEHA